MDATTYGLDLAKRVFHAHWVDAAGKPHNRKMSRERVLEFFAKQPPGMVAVEACGSAHHWGRELEKLGHQVKLIATQHVHRFVLTNKSDAADAQAIWTAARQPGMRTVRLKTLDEQTVTTLLAQRQLLIKERTAAVNAIRGLMAEYGVILRVGRAAGLEELRRRLPEIEQIVSTKVLAALAGTMSDLRQRDERISELEQMVKAQLENDARYQALLTIPGVGPLTAALLWAKLGDARQFRSGREAAAWAGVVPRHSGTGGKIVLGHISKRGDPTLRTMLIHGARSVIAHSKNPSPWLKGMLARRPANVVAVALANKMMRIAWKLLVSNTTYDSAHDPHARRKLREQAQGNESLAPQPA